MLDLSAEDLTLIPRIHLLEQRLENMSASRVGRYLIEAIDALYQMQALLLV